MFNAPLLLRGRGKLKNTKTWSGGSPGHQEGPAIKRCGLSKDQWQDYHQHGWQDDKWEDSFQKHEQHGWQECRDPRADDPYGSTELQLVWWEGRSGRRTGTDRRLSFDLERIF
jgi:hypothetical protein